MINNNEIQYALDKTNTIDAIRVRDILAKAYELQGLSLDEVACLINVTDKQLISEIFDAANNIKQNIYGNRLVLFAPLYISNLCNNECSYCAFRANNTALRRCFLNLNEIKKETEILINQGHKRLLLVSGESYPDGNLQYVLDAISKIYQTTTKNGEIRRINVNIAPLATNEFKRLKDYKIGTYQLFQETYHQDTYSSVHLAGKKTDYKWRITAIDRAIEAGIDDVGIGALFGLYDWRYETLALLQHSNYLQKKFGVGPHTISVPRLEPAVGCNFRSNYLVSDEDFCKLVAILRLSIPYTGMIMSTRESPDIREQTLSLGISQLSAGSRTEPGGYSSQSLQDSDAEQFVIGDHRCLDEVINHIATLGYIPSFCTACYRSGRTGEHFMDLAKPGKIKHMCMPNAISTFAEYISYYATPKTKLTGQKLIAKLLIDLPQKQQQIIKQILNKINSGQKDIYI